MIGEVDLHGWPAEITRCLECGAVKAVGHDNALWAVECRDGGMHGPTQTVSVIPYALVGVIESILAECERVPDTGTGLDGEIAFGAVSMIENQAKEAMKGINNA